jgi:ADP-ribose pyrophosphatase
VNIFNKEEFEEIKEKLNNSAAEIEHILNFKGNNFLNRMKSLVVKDRRGEVVFGVVRPNGKLILVTCEEYPEGIYRVPTGGINFGEDVLEAVKRETMEELGLTTEIANFGGVVKLKFTHDDDSEMFYCYLFLLKEVAGRLLEDATDVEVSQVMEADYEDILKACEKLNNIEGKMSDWGKFRAVTTGAIAQMYKAYIEE